MAANLGRQLWKRATTIYTEAEVGYTADGDNVGRGGVASIVSPRWAKLVSQSGSLFGGRVLYLILDRIPGGQLGFLNICVPNDPLARKILWETLARELPTTCRWIMIGDFNMVERLSDKSNGGHSISAQIRLLFNGLKDILQVEEYPLTSPSLTYSWDNSRSDLARTMARLDRCYLFPKSPSCRRQLLEYKIKGNHTWSDHCPISVILELATTPDRPSRWAMSSLYFEDADHEIRHAWESAPLQASFFTKLK